MTVMDWPSSAIASAGQSRTVITWSAEAILEEHGGRWTARDPETGIFGSGATPEAALGDFRRALREHLDLLTRQDALSGELAAQLAYLRQRLSS